MKLLAMVFGQKRGEFRKWVLDWEVGVGCRRVDGFGRQNVTRSWPLRRFCESQTHRAELFEQ